MDAELPELVLPIDQRDNVFGPLSARYSLVEYGDYESSACRLASATVREVIRELEDDLCFAFRNFPQPDVHPRAVPAAEAAEGADLQAKFWLMHDRLFEHQSDLSDGVIQRLVRELPLDLPTFERDLASGAPARRVAQDLESGREAGVAETPTFFINGRMHVGSYEFLPLLEALRKTP